MLRRLAVFPSDFSLEAAESVTARTEAMEGPEGSEVLDIVGRLTDKSLLTVSLEEASGVRYRLLETVRQYAAGKLADAGETAATQERHRDFFTVNQDWFTGILNGRWLRWAETEADNLRAALERSREQNDSGAILRLATPQWMYWCLSGAADTRDWLERAVAAPGPGDVALRVFARLGLGLVLRETGEDQDGRSELLMREALALALEHDDEYAAAWARFYLLELAATQGRLQEAEALSSEADRTFRRHGISEAYGSMGVALVCMAQGDLDRAREHGERALVAMGEKADDYCLIQILGQLVLVEAAAGNEERAALAAQTVAAARLIPGRRILVMALSRAATAAVSSDRFEAAQAYLDELLGILRELGGRGWVAEALELTAIVLGPGGPRRLPPSWGRRWPCGSKMAASPCSRSGWLSAVRP